MPRARLAISLALLTALLITLGCGGGGGGGGGGDGGSIGGPGPVSTGQFGVTLGPTGGKLLGLNLSVSLQFSKGVDASTVSGSTLKVVTVTDPAGTSTAPAGSLASVTYAVSGSVVTIQPTVTFSPTKVDYGFVSNALYEITFTPPFPGPSVKSTGGEVMVNPNSTFFFRTPAKGFDFQPGYPPLRVFVIDDPKGAVAPVVLPATIVDQPGPGGQTPDGDLVAEAVSYFGNPIEVTEPTSPVDIGVSVRPILFVFSDAIIPTSVVNPVNGSSPSLKVQVNAAKPPALAPKTIPALHSMFHQQKNLTLVLWEPKAVAYPPGAFLFLTVLPTVQDLALNTKQSITGSGDPAFTGSLRVVGVDGSLYSLIEPFDNTAKKDVSASSAAWAVLDPTPPGFTVLAPVLGGGTGADGPLIVDPLGTASVPGTTTLPPSAKIDFATKTLFLPTVVASVTGFVPREYAFTTLQLPEAWTLKPLTDRDGDGTPDPDEYVVQSAGHPLDGLGAPLRIRCTGLMDIQGTVDVTGPAAATLVRPKTTSDPAYAAYQGQGATGAMPLLAAGTGGHGGDVLLLDKDDQIVFPLLSPTPDYESSDGKLRGVTGLATGLSATTLSDAARQFTRLSDVGDPVLSGLLSAGELRLQPNVGVGSSLVGNAGTPNESIDENHPTFVISGVVNDSTVTVAPDSGAMNQPSDNFGNEYAPIASVGDPFLVGRLHGRAGDDLTPLDRGGPGAEPFVVVNEGALGVSTTGGGGGGGGSIDSGLSGESDGPDANPLVDQRGTSGGIAKTESSGAAGGRGTIRGTARVTGATTLDVETQTSGRALAELVGPDLVGAQLIPNSTADGWLFEIEAFDGTTFTVQPIESDAAPIDLLDGPGAGGPGLTDGQVYSFAIIPSLDIGGGGGGGTGVSVTGTVNVSPSVLPLLTPGAAGGAGGGSVLLETASELRLGAKSQILARGGVGGSVFDLQTGYAGAGGGGGGNAVLRAGTVFTVIPGARVSVEGGAGGGVTGSGKGGTGGAGYIRLENFADTLSPASFATTTLPVVTAMNIGRMFGISQGIGQSLFYQTTVLNPEWSTVVVSYRSDTDGDGLTEPFTWAFGANGATSVPSDQLDPPFRVYFNSVGFDGFGFLATDKVDNSFHTAADLVSARTGLAWDAANGVLLHCVGRNVHQIHRLDPATLLPVAVGPQTILLPTIPSAATDFIDIVSLAVGGPAGEIFVLERATSRVHVLDLATGAFRRTITLPLELNGAMTYLPPPLDLLAFVDNRNDRLVTFHRVNPDTGNLTQNYAPSVPVGQFVVTRDGVPLDLEVVGLTYDAAAQRLWCTDAQAARIFQLDLSTGNEGQSLTGSESDSALYFDLDAGSAPDPVAVLPSAVAFNGTDLFLVHAVDPVDSRVRRLARTAVDPGGVGADTVLDDFGTLLPEPALSIADGNVFLRFRILLDGQKDVGATMFRKVRVDSITLTYENEPF